MSASSSPTETIYVRLLDEGTDVWRPTLGRKVGPMAFEILPTLNYDAASERWEFPPGAIVVCQLWRRSYLDGIGRSLTDPPIDERKRAERDAGGPVLVALRLWEPDPPLPTPSPRLRLVSSQELRDLRGAVEKRDPECLVCVGEILPGDSVPLAPERALVDLAVLALGEALARWPRTDAPTETWRRIDRIQAERHLRYVLGHDLAYESVVLDELETLRITQSFLSLFGQDAMYFTNHDISERGSPGSGTPLLNATFEGGIGVVDGGRAGLLFVTGED